MISCGGELAGLDLDDRLQLSAVSFLVAHLRPRAGYFAGPHSSPPSQPDGEADKGETGEDTTDSAAYNRSDVGGG